MKIKRAAASVAAIICAAVFALPVYAENAAVILSDSSSVTAESAVSEADSSSEESTADESSSSENDSSSTEDSTPTDESASENDSEKPDEAVVAPFDAALGDYGLNWAKIRITSVAGAQYYEIRNKRGNTLIRTVTPEQVYGDILLEGLAPARSFQAVVTAYFADGTSRVTEKFSIRTKSMPRVSDCTVSDRTSTTGTTVSCKVNWTPIDPATGITGFVVCNGSTNEVLATVNDPSATSATIENLSAGDELTVCVRSVLEQNGETYKGAVSIKRWVHCRPQTPVVSADKSNPTSVKINFNACQGAMGYMIYTSADGVNYSRVSIRKGADNTSYTFNNVNPNVNTFVKVRAYKKVNETKFYSSYSEPVNLKADRPVYEQRTVTANATMFSSTSFGSNSVRRVNSGSKVSVIEKTGRWYYCEFGGYRGYIYNRALGDGSNVANLPAASRISIYNAEMYAMYADACADETLFELNKDGDITPYRIMTYTKQMRYDHYLAGTISDNAMVVYTYLRKNNISCYYYAAFNQKLLERSGYPCYKIVGKHMYEPEGQPGPHAWDLYQMKNGKWRHLDSCPAVWGHTTGIDLYEYTDAQMRDIHLEWDYANYPAAN